MHGGDIYRNKVDIDFSVNISPLGIPRTVRQALEEAVGRCVHYPDLRSEELVRALAEYLAVRPEQICVGNGASELFGAILKALKPRGRILIPAPAFGGYERSCRALGYSPVFIPCREGDGFALTELLLQRLDGETGLLFLTNPGNPAGRLVEEGLLMRLLERAGRLGIRVVLDECFLEFVPDWRRRTMAGRLQGLPHVIVVRAFTKICAIPGARIGYCICGERSVAEAIRSVLPEWNVSVFAQCAGVAAAKTLGGSDYLEMVWRLLGEQRAYLQRELTGLGLRVYGSDANFLLLYSDRELYEPLKQRGILIRDCADYRGLGKGYYRIAVRGLEDNRALLGALGEALPDLAQADKVVERYGY